MMRLVVLLSLISYTTAESSTLVPFSDDHGLDEVMFLQQGLSHDSHTDTIAAEKTHGLERNIFLFWNQGWSADLVPEYVLANAQSWKVQNPTWTVHMLDGNNDTLAQFFNQSVIDMLWIQESYAFKSDLVRTFALAGHGGVYADADVLCAKPLDEYIDAKMSAGFYAFRQAELDIAETGPRYLSSWFLAANRGGYIISRMAEAMVPVASPQGVDFANEHPEETYYRWHYTFALLTRNDPYFKMLWDTAPNGHWIDYSCFEAGCAHAPCVHKYKVDASLGFDEFQEDIDQECANVYKTDYTHTPKSWVDYATMHTLAKM